MSRIKILPESLANQIAAGEVVERPAAVVKELLENAIDAGASTIEVHVEGAGSRCIRVIDNGSGMDQDDILLCLERHATSKLSAVEQLSSINTLGFRGEAIPSIASVSKVTITSRTPSSNLGSSIYVHFGSIKKVHEMGCAVGTMVEVRDLFGNVPARRKFLKSAQTELSHIDEVVRSYCLANPQIGFSYKIGGKTVLELLENADSEKTRFESILATQIDLIEIPTDTESQGAQTNGFLVPPERSSGKSAKLWTFVNGRFVKDRVLNHAISEGMQGFLMKGRRPGGVVFVNLLPGDVDVNVHPTKQEVRFKNAPLVHRTISSAVSDALRNYQQQLRKEVFGVRQSEESVSSGSFECSEEKPLSISSSSAPEVVNVLPEQFVSAGDGQRQNSIFNKPLFPSEKVREPQPSYNVHPATSVEADTKVEPESLSEARPELPEEDECFGLKTIGQLFGTYILCELKDGFVAVDQHAAQERLFFEEIKSQYEKTFVPSQKLLFPEMVDLSTNEISVIEQFSSEIERLGLDVKEFGGETYVVNAIPASMANISGEEVLRDVLDRLDNDKEGKENMLDRVFSSMACKASIKAGHRLTNQEIQSLLVQMQQAGTFSHCPHGRPVFKKFSRHDVEKWFFRS